ncbi:hypothetical protein [Spiribacter insolitus]|uniref:Uncharacterized protein n=1 Tax=Spiribacter insolitus TaxID=3122417 RepID=A0ABV3T479_9GAMM
MKNFNIKIIPGAHHHHQVVKMAADIATNAAFARAYCSACHPEDILDPDLDDFISRIVFTGLIDLYLWVSKELMPVQLTGLEIDACVGIRGFGDAFVRSDFAEKKGPTGEVGFGPLIEFFDTQG